MDATSIRQYIARTFAGADVVDASCSSIYDPEHRFPFATLTTSHKYDPSPPIAYVTSDSCPVPRYGRSLGPATYKHFGNITHVDRDSRHPGIPDTRGFAASPWGSKHPHFIGWLKVG
jgi:hypothetical protein